MTNIIDQYGGHHTSASSASISVFERAVCNLAAHRPVQADLDSALRHQPDLVAAHALRGFSQVTLANAEGTAEAKRLVGVSRSWLTCAGGGTAGERALVEALASAADGRLQAAADRLTAHLEQSPRDFLAAKLAHGLHLMSGRLTRMLATTSMILPHWSKADAGYGHLLGCHAFGLEENRDYDQADRVGRAAIGFVAHDVWGLHAVAHVMEMRGQLDAGVAWLEPTRHLWGKCGGFGHHLAWHLALFRLAQGDVDSALALYDAHLRPAETADFRDVANAVSLLWRLEQDGFDAGDRWAAIEHIARSRRHDTSYVFGSLHYIIALVAAGDLIAAGEAITALRSSAAAGDTDQAGVSASVGVRLAEVILAMRLRVARSSQSSVDLADLARRLPELGGSNAQRDIFLRTLMQIAVRTGDGRAVGVLTELRLAQRKLDRFQTLIENRLRSSMSLRSKVYAVNALAPH